MHTNRFTIVILLLSLYSGMTISASDPSRLTLGTGMWDSCGIIYDGSVQCWGFEPYQIVSGAEGFFHISIGGFQGCGLRHVVDDNTGSNINCWGNSQYTHSPPPPGIYSQISVGAGSYSCAIKAVDHSLVCWGANMGQYGIWYNQATPPSQGSFRQVSAGYWHACAISFSDNTVKCWGRNTGYDDQVYCGQANPLGGQFLQVSSGGLHTCGIRTNGSVDCWGCDDDGQVTTKPEGNFIQIDAGFLHTCGLKVDGSVVCWGYNGFEQSTVPTTTTAFTQISAGHYHTCGVTSSNGSNVVCWGIPDNQWWGFGQTTPPEGIHLMPAVDYSYIPTVKPLSGVPIPQFFLYPYNGDTQIFGGKDIGIMLNARNSYDTESDQCCIRNYLWWVFDPQKPYKPYYAEGSMHQVPPSVLNHAGDYFVSLIVIDEEGHPSTPIGTMLILK